MGLSTQNSAYYGAWPNDLMARTTVLCAVDESRHVCDERHSAVCSRCPGLQCGCPLIAALCTKSIGTRERENISINVRWCFPCENDEVQRSESSPAPSMMLNVVTVLVAIVTSSAAGGETMLCSLPSVCLPVHYRVLMHATQLPSRHQCVTASSTSCVIAFVFI